MALSESMSHRACWDIDHNGSLAYILASLALVGLGYFIKAFAAGLG